MVSPTPACDRRAPGKCAPRSAAERVALSFSRSYPRLTLDLPYLFSRFRPLRPPKWLHRDGTYAIRQRISRAFEWYISLVVHRRMSRFFSWVSRNGIWKELPYLLKELP